MMSLDEMLNTEIKETSSELLVELYLSKDEYLRFLFEGGLPVYRTLIEVVYENLETMESQSFFGEEARKLFAHFKNDIEDAR